MLNFTLIGDECVKKIPIQDSDEPLIDIQTEFPDLIFETPKVRFNGKIYPNCWGRREIGKRLKIAQNLLPSGIFFKIDEIYRPVVLQRYLWDKQFFQIQIENPNWSLKQITLHCMKFVAPVDLAPHVCGAAVDLTLVDLLNQPLDMGMDIQSNEPYHFDLTRTYSDKISLKAKENRKLLVSVMEQAGFVNYPAEWWHFSYGDKYWAYITDQKAALYGPVNAEILLP